MDLLTIFLTGLLTGGLTCLAVQGGLLFAAVGQGEVQKTDKKNLRQRSITIAIFLIFKIIGYSTVGLLLGLFGSIFNISLTVRIWMQIFVSIFMIGTALALMDIHPIFRYFIIQPPSFLTRFIRAKSKIQSFFTPAILGFLTIFIPCGTTQAMMALAIASGNPIKGLAILLAFTIGTAPLFFIFGLITVSMVGVLQKKFIVMASFLILMIAVLNIDNALVLSGSKLNLSNLWWGFNCTFLTFCQTQDVSYNDLSDNPELDLHFYTNRYEPKVLTVKKGVKVKLNLINNDAGGCIQAFTIPSLGIEEIVRMGEQKTIEFNAPKKASEIDFMCSMGMYRGRIKVI